MPGSLSGTLRSLVDAADAIARDAPSELELESIVAHGGFRPREDEAIGFWFARMLSVRASLWALIDEVLAALGKSPNAIRGRDELRYFVIGYGAVCVLVRVDRVMLFRVAKHSIVQRKLNEPFPEYRIPRKQYTRIFSALVDQANVLAIREAMLFATSHRDDIMGLGTDPDVGFIVQRLEEFESYLNPSKLGYLRRSWTYVSHKWRRRGVVSATNILAAVLEGFGRTASELYDTRNKQVGVEVRETIGNFLQPGDVIVTRHAKALTNFFLPGFWPHSSLYVGTQEQREKSGVTVDQAREQLWVDDICVLEARKDGVRLRPLSDTLAVDMFVVLRPALAIDSIRQAIERAIPHEGKMYNFDFDFFNSDRLVCTEVVYRAYDGLENLRFPLPERAGRKALSVEDMLDFALDEGAFEPVAIFGVDGCEKEIVHGSAVRDILVATYRKPPTGPVAP